MGRHRTDFQTFGATSRQPYDSRNRPVQLPSDGLLVTRYTQHVGMRIRRLREEAGLHQAALATRAQKADGSGYKPGLISRMERGMANPPLRAYIDVATALEVAPGILMGPREVEMAVDETEMTLIRLLRRLGIGADEAIARIVAGDQGAGVS